MILQSWLWWDHEITDTHSFALPEMAADDRLLHTSVRLTLATCCKEHPF